VRLKIKSGTSEIGLVLVFGSNVVCKGALFKRKAPQIEGLWVKGGYRTGDPPDPPNRRSNNEATITIYIKHFVGRCFPLTVWQK